MRLLAPFQSGFGGVVLGEEGDWGPAGGLWFLALWLSEQNMQKVREEKVQKESKRKLPFAEHLLLPEGTLMNFISAHNHPEKQELGGACPFHRT